MAAAAWKIAVGKGLKLTQNYEQKVEERGNGLCNRVWVDEEGDKETGTDQKAQPSGTLSNQNPNTTLTVCFPEN